MRLCYGLLLASIAACGSSTSYSGNTPPPPPGAPPPAPSTVFVSVSEFQFSPDTVRIKTGIPVRWTNGGTLAHTVTSDSTGLFNSGLAAGGGSQDPYGMPVTGTTYDRTFSDPGTFSYHCSNHPQMKGVVIVSP